MKRFPYFIPSPPLHLPSTHPSRHGPSPLLRTLIPTHNNLPARSLPFCPGLCTVVIKLRFNCKHGQHVPTASVPCSHLPGLWSITAPTFIRSASHSKWGLELLTDFHIPDTNFNISYVEFPEVGGGKKASSGHSHGDTADPSNPANDVTVESPRQGWKERGRGWHHILFASVLLGFP